VLHQCRTFLLLHGWCPPPDLNCALALIIILIAPSRSSSSSRRLAHHFLCAVPLNFIFALLPSSSLLRRCAHLIIATFDFLPSCSSLLSRPSRAHLSIFFFALLRPHLHGAGRAPIIIVAPIANPSSSSRPLRAHRAPIFIVAPIVRPSSSSRPSRAHLHRRAHCAPIFIVAPIAHTSSSSRPSRTHLHRCAHRAPIFIVAPIARPSSSLRPSRTHLHHRAHRAPIFIVVPIARPSSTVELSRWALQPPSLAGMPSKSRSMWNQI
jgi:hypothetical protein